MMQFPSPTLPGIGQKWRKHLVFMEVMTEIDQNPTKYGINFENVGFGQKVTKHPLQ